MHFTAATAVASGLILARAATAQVYPPFDQDSVSDSLKAFWCQSQVAACPLLCGDRETTTISNECYPENLYYTCVCDDNKSPDLALYSQTIPYFTCTTVVQACVDNCKGAALCGQKCRESKPCGAQGEPNGNKTSSTKTKTSSTASKTSTSLPTETADDFEAGFGSTSKDTNKDKNSGASSMFVKSSYGFATVIVGLAAGFTIFL